MSMTARGRDGLMVHLSLPDAAALLDGNVLA